MVISLIDGLFDYISFAWLLCLLFLEVQFFSLLQLSYLLICEDELSDEYFSLISHKMLKFKLTVLPSFSFFIFSILLHFFGVICLEFFNNSLRSVSDFVSRMAF